MSIALKSTIHCFLTSEAEYKVLYRLSRILGQHLSRLSAKEFNIQFEYHDASKVVPEYISHEDLCIRSLLHHVFEDNISLDTIKNCHTQGTSNSKPNTPNKTFLLTIFHYVNPLLLAEHDLDIQSIVQRIRAINLAALEASNSVGFGVLDIDGIFSRLGANNLKTDYKMRGNMAHQVAADFISTALLQDENILDHFGVTTDHRLQHQPFENFFKRAFSFLARIHSKIPQKIQTN